MANACGAPLDRRRFLRMTGAAAGAALIPASILKALAIPANNRTGTIRDVEHVVILMQENRSFDHYFGTLPGVRGFADRFTIPQASGKPIWHQQDLSQTDILPFHLDAAIGNAQRVDGTPHNWDDAHHAWNDGRYGYWPVYKRAQSMGYYTEAELPFQFALADAFTVCDAYHAAIHSSTNPNRLMLFTGMNDPSGTGGGPIIDNVNDDLGPSAEGFRWTTYPERLEAAGVSWKVYQDMADNFTDNSLEGFATFRAANERDPSSPLVTRGLSSTLRNNTLDGLRDDVLAGRLPQVSYIVAPAAYSEHPDPSCPVQGGWYAQAVLDSLTADPEVWSKTVLLLTFDENDGFFDHLPPPSAHSIAADGRPAGASTVDDRLDRHQGSSLVDRNWPYGPGPRVPMTVISPWSRGGWVCSETYDHTSIIRFLEARFGVEEPNISPRRRAICGDLTRCFNFATPNDSALPSLPRLTRSEADAQRLAQEQLPQIPAPRGRKGHLPQQALGLKPSRALPYELAADAAVNARGLRLDFVNTGTLGAVFHVYDQRHLHELPRRYTVEAGKALDDLWTPLLSDLGAYDLWLLGPNGFHRQYAGRLGLLDPAVNPEVELRHDPAGGGLMVKLVNAGHAAVTFVITAQAYRDKRPRRVTVAAGRTKSLRIDLQDSGRWYDYSVRIEGERAVQQAFLRRFAGRVENGEPSFSDPAMGTPRTEASRPLAVA
ncbi:phosphocholine-specific phospholipase C [Nevskia ramosa]|uniref:phosphocholine-specific phospholipase C n=1 Tax=Nevskia ramosa TaxID=64002 RepID=UPI0003B650CE|nr:phospholipase C, phosphocholine-specific [Nevskia ramosa]